MCALDISSQIERKNGQVKWAVNAERRLKLAEDSILITWIARNWSKIEFLTRTVDLHIIAEPEILPKYVRKNYLPTVGLLVGENIDQLKTCSECSEDARWDYPRF